MQSPGACVNRFEGLARRRETAFRMRRDVHVQRRRRWYSNAMRRLYPFFAPTTSPSTSAARSKTSASGRKTLSVAPASSSSNGSRVAD